jgi:hypothetical protein
VSREELGSLGRRQKLAGEHVHRGGVNGGPAGRCARAGRGGMHFIGGQRMREVCVWCLGAREGELRRGRVAVEVHSTSPAGGTAGGPAGALAARAHVGARPQAARGAGSQMMVPASSARLSGEWGARRGTSRRRAGARYGAEALLSISKLPCLDA